MWACPYGNASCQRINNLHQLRANADMTLNVDNYQLGEGEDIHV